MGDDDAPSDVAEIERIISLIDLTDLDDAHRPDGIDALVAHAAGNETAAVCVWPEFVARCAHALAGTGVRVATVVNFPSGTGTTDGVAAEVVAALEAGADEVDVVLPWRQFLDGDIDHIRGLLGVVADLVHRTDDAQLKVILESGELASIDAIAEASSLAIGCGADFLKTSTGKSGTGASLDAVSAMLGVIADDGGSVGIKPSGGIRTVADARSYLDLAARELGDEWATPGTFRFGASGLLGDALDAIARV